LLAGAVYASANPVEIDPYVALVMHRQFLHPLAEFKQRSAEPMNCAVGARPTLDSFTPDLRRSRCARSPSPRTSPSTVRLSTVQGGGRRLFPDGFELPSLRLVDAKHFRSGVTYTCYAPA